MGEDSLGKGVAMAIPAWFSSCTVIALRSRRRAPGQSQAFSRGDALVQIMPERCTMVPSGPALGGWYTVYRIRMGRNPPTAGCNGHRLLVPMSGGPQLPRDVPCASAQLPAVS